MSTTVESTIRSHLQANDAVQETIKWAEIVARLGSDTPLVATPTRSPRFGVWIALAAVVVTVLLVGLIPLLFNNDGPPAADTVVSTTLVESTPTTLADTVVTTIADATPGPRLTDDIPPSVESGVVETPAGSARWVRLNPDDQNLPWGGQLVEWSKGFAIFVPPNGGTMSFWVSDDGINWDSRPLPVSEAENASLTQAGGVFWLSTSNPTSVWFSEDGISWREPDVEGRLSPEPDGFVNWDAGFQTSVIGNAVLVLGNFGGQFPYGDYVPNFEDTGCVERLVEVGPPGVYRMDGDERSSECPNRPDLLLIEDDTGLQVFDNATGELLGHVAGADLGHIDRMIGTDELSAEILWLAENGTVVALEPPWEPASSGVALFNSGDTVYSYVRDRAGRLSVWQTSDGLSWTEVGVAGLPAELLSGNAWISSLPGVLVGYADDEAWDSTDGVNWKPAPAGRPEGSNLVRLPAGWFATDGSKGGSRDGNAWWWHVKGEWIPLAAMGMENPEPTVAGQSGCVVGTTGNARTTIFYRGDCLPMDGSVEVWVLDSSTNR